MKHFRGQTADQEGCLVQNGCVRVSSKLSHPVSGGRSSFLRNKLLPWSLASGLALAFGYGAIWASAGMLAPTASQASTPTQPDTHAISVRKFLALGDQPQLQVASLYVDTDGLGAALPKQQDTPARKVKVSKVSPAKPQPAPVNTATARFDAVAKKAALSPQKLASLFKQPKPVAKENRLVAKAPVAPAPERFANTPASAPVMLAYADPSPKANSGAIQALWQVAPLGEDLSNKPQPNGETNALAVPGFETTPDSVGVPGRRPRTEQVEKPETPVEKPETQAVKPEKPEPEVIKPKPENKPKLAYARPNDPSERKPDGGGFLSKLFGGNGGSGGVAGGKGIAVYDISAAKVYMPDGSVLEAHSGIGEMADNPRYVKHKMKGPTPPHVYNLRMREKRFHGVEAIRMLPVDGKNKFGRDGFLTHSYLLRGGRAESHGCVAFKDYNKFLNAFKKGKIKQLVVVPSGGRSSGLRMARNGNSA